MGQDAATGKTTAYPHQPSDKLVKGTFGNPANAAVFFQSYLEPTAAANVFWDSLRLENTSFVDEGLKGFESDLLFSAKTTSGEGLLYLLFEHQSSEDHWMSLRLLNYMVRIWERKSKTRPAPAKLSPILPVVLTQSAEPWKNTEGFQSLFSQEGALWNLLKRFTPEFSYRLVELRTLRFEEIKGTPAGILALRALKASAGKEWLSDPVWDEELLAQLSSRELEQWLRYIYSRDVGRLEFKCRVGKLRNFFLREGTMTLEQQIREEGKHEGHLEGKREALLTVLGTRFGALSSGLKGRVESISDAAVLDRLFVEALGSGSLAEFEALIR